MNSRKPSENDLIEKRILQLPSSLNALFALSILTIISYVWIFEKRAIGEFNGTDLISFPQFFGAVYGLLSKIVLVIEGTSFPLILFIAIGVYRALWRQYYEVHHPYKIGSADKDDKELERKCLNLCNTLGLMPHPKIMLTNSPEISPWVFWKFNHYLIIPRDFLKKFKSNEQELNAVLLHELAHIKNNDVLKTILIQILSTAYLIVAAILTFLRILTSLSILNIGYSSIISELYRTVPIILSTSILLFLNRIVLRHRELAADRLAVFIQKDNIHLRSAIIKCGNNLRESLPFSFAGSSKKSNFIYRLLQYHPLGIERNRYLYYPTLKLTTSLGIAAVAGFASIIAVETGLRAIGMSPTGEGLPPLISVCLELLAGILVLGTFIFPALLNIFYQKGSISILSILNSLVLLILSWSFGAFLGSLSSILPLQPEILKFQSIWAFLSTYIGYHALDLFLSCLLALLFLRIVISRPDLLIKRPISFRFFYLPSFLAYVPFFIWYSFYAYHIADFNLGGISAKPVQQAIGFILIYLSAVFVFFSRLANSQPVSSITILNKPSSIVQPLLLDKAAIHFQSWASLLATILTTIVCFSIVMGWRLEDYNRKYYYLQSVNNPPPNESPLGFERYSDSSLRATMVYPEGWVIENADDQGEVARIFHDPTTLMKLDVRTFAETSTLTTRERLNLLTLVIFGSSADANFLQRMSEPVEMQTNAGPATGYRVEFDAPSGEFVQIAVLAVDSIYAGAGYEFTLTCEPSEKIECRNVFQMAVNNFDVVSPRLQIEGSISESNSYIDRTDGFEFRYPFSWGITNIYASDTILTNPPVFRLPQDNPSYWKQVELHPNDDSPNTLQVSYSQRDFAVDIADRMRMWKEFQTTQNPNNEKFTLTGETALFVDGVPANRMDFEITYIDGLQLQGTITILTEGQNLWELFSLCTLDFRARCNSSYSQILDTFRVLSPTDQAHP